MITVYLDFETYSEAGYACDPASKKRIGDGLKGVGAARYAEHPSTDVLSLSYLIDSGDMCTWTPDSPQPAQLFAALNAGSVFVAANSLFEWLIWACVCVRRYGWPQLPLHRMYDTLAAARAAGYPANLEKLSQYVLNTGKQANGKKLVRLFSVPDTKFKRANPINHIEQFQQFLSYNRQDVRLLKDLAPYVPRLSESEHALWQLDQTINIRGVAIDVPAINTCIHQYERAATRLTDELQDATGGVVQSVGEVDKTLLWLKNTQGLILPSLDKKNLPDLLKGKHITPVAKRVLEIRESVGSASVKKLYKMRNSVCSDGRLRGLFTYYGANTGRWAGGGAQSQNLPRSMIKDWDAEKCEAALSDMRVMSIDTLEAKWGGVIPLISSCLRGLFVSAKGYDFVSSDFSAIEAVVLSEIAGEEWRLEVFNTHGLIYEKTASLITGVPFEEFLAYKKTHGTHHPLRNKIGKYAELASGYGGGVQAWLNFGAGEHLTEEEIAKAIKKWRAVCPKIVSLWYDTERLVKTALKNTYREYNHRGVSVYADISALYVRLPSGRYLTYRDMRDVDGILCYYTWRKGAWVEVYTHGARIVENITQATSRDVLAAAMIRLERADYPVIMHVHDEAVCEVPERFGCVAQVESIMRQNPDWCRNWAIRASGGWRGKRYRK